MGTAKLIHDTAVDLLWKQGVNASDGFRQWLYVRPYGAKADYNISKEARKFIETMISQGKSAAEINEAAKKKGQARYDSATKYRDRGTAKAHV